MKVKEVDRTANFAWSPNDQHSIHIAVGTAAQQLDASFSTTAALELYSLNLNEPGYDLGLKSTLQSDHRFHKLCWGSHSQSSGTIVGGCDGGVIQIYNATKLIAGDSGTVTTQHNKHKGSVRALDFNSFQSNLLASGASESEIYIWDLNNPSTPMTPGSKCQPFEDVASIAWNKQVQHILASTFPTKCVVWDLRKNDPIIKLSDSTVRVKWHVVAWNPDVATQLCLGSEEDQSPVIQLWDLRFATSPLKIFENHQKGVLSISWCHQDTDMLLSCGRDNKIICWNPNSNTQGSEINCEFLLPNQWNFDVSWCPRNPALFGSSSFDGHVSIYSLYGSPQQVQTSNKIADSFPGMELYSHTPVSQSHGVPFEMRKVPKWLKKPVGAKFGFGGKLVTFENNIGVNNEIHSRKVCVNQIVTEEELLSRSSKLESALQTTQYSDFCQDKIMSVESTHEKMLWKFLAANFESSPRAQFLNLLGFHKEETNQMKKLHSSINPNYNDVPNVSNQLSNLGISSTSEVESDLPELTSSTTDDGHGQGIELKSLLVNSNSKSPLKDFKILTGNDVDGSICQALLLGNVEVAVDICLRNNRMADAIILAMAGGSELLAKTQYIYLQQKSDFLSSLISAVVMEDWSQVIKNCSVESWKEALAAAITHANEEEFPILCEMLGERLNLEENQNLSRNAEFCFICAGNLSKVVSSWMKRNKKISPEYLQELVELVMILKKAIELKGIKVDISGRIAALLTNYACILVSQGSIETALSYLGDSNDTLISELRDRLYGSLGKSHPYTQNSRKPVSSHMHSQRTGSVSAGFYPPQRVQEDVVTAPPVPQHHFNLNPLTSSGVVPNNFGNHPYPSASPLATSGQRLPPMQQTPTNRAFAAPSPGPNPGGLTSRSKHVLDPSVQSSTHSSYYSQNQYPPSSYASQPVLSTPNYNINSPGYPIDTFNPYPTNPTPPLPSTVPKLIPSTQPPGWNDPPVVDSSRNFPKTDFLPQNPITQPLLGGPQEIGEVNGRLYGSYVGTHQQQVSLPNVPSQYQTNPSQQLPYPQYTSSVMPQPKVSDVQSGTVREIVKKPIPNEHIVLQNIFDELKNKCCTSASNPQTKRKLDDVSKKLEVLYDSLRDEKLSLNTLQGLHVIVEHIQRGDYANGLILHTQLVSGPDFSQIAGFMPAIKVLLQSAMQLQVYL